MAIPLQPLIAIYGACFTHNGTIYGPAGWESAAAQLPLLNRA